MTVRLAPSFEVVSVPSDAVIEFAVERIITRLKRADGDQSPAVADVIRRALVAALVAALVLPLALSVGIENMGRRPPATQPGFHFHDAQSCSLKDLSTQRRVYT